ncbi:MAG: CPBP family intramembrane metalloprotease [Firmicutes bacterium]|nr:CPBP family intramembrane metalloprotease [Bacillota bacterium]
MEKNIKKITIRNLIIFTVVVTASGWIGRGLDILMGNPSKDSLGMLLWLIIPFIISLFLRTFAGDGWSDIGIKPFFKNNIIWYIIAVFIFPVVTIIDLFIGNSLGWINFSNFKLGLFLQFFSGLLIFNFFKNILEEFAWRGYLAPKVLLLNLNDFATYILVGIVWGIWHIPYYLFFLDTLEYQSVSMQSLSVFIPLSVVVMISWSISFVELRRLTNSVWPVVLMHMVEDAFVNPLFIYGLIEISPGKDLFISPIYGILSIISFIAIGLGLRQLRKKRNTPIKGKIVI